MKRDLFRGEPSKVLGAKLSNLRHITVCGWWEAIHARPTDKYLAISMVSHNTPHPQLPELENRRGILRLNFDDINIAEEHGQELRERAMRPQHALAVWQFLLDHGDAHHYLIHCEVGVSRSPSVAMAICDEVGASRLIIKSDRNPKELPPNPFVYQTMRRAARAFDG